MGSIHLLEDREHVLVPFRSDGAGEHVRDRCLIDTGARRQPQRDRIKSPSVQTLCWSNASPANAATNFPNHA
jgi:predicted aspartyl protease